MDNTLKQTTSGSFGALQEDHRLWQELEQMPDWWKTILKDDELYVEIRKDNYINVYYYGGNVALLRWAGGKIKAETHQKYLGCEQPDRPLYKDCFKQLQTKEGLSAIKKWINEIYTSKEKHVQGELKICFKERYIDSEFAYQIKERETMRIDLVELRGKDLHFIELKLIGDARLRTKDGDPEIISQMDTYRTFIKTHTDELKSYYTKLLRIKKKIGVWNGDTEIECVSLIPELLVINTYAEESKGKVERREYIKNLGEGGSFHTNIITYNDLCE